MKRVLILLMVLAGAAALMIFTACSDDDDSGTNSNASIDPADSAFVSEFFDESQWLEFMYTLELSMALLDEMGQVGSPSRQVPRMALVEGEGIIIDGITSYNYDNGWHIFEFEATVVDEDTVQLAGRDSVKVMQEGSPIEYPWEIEHIDEVYVRAHVNFTLQGDLGYGALHHVVGATESVSGTDTTYTVNGTVSDTMYTYESWEGDGLCEIDLALNQTITNLVMPGGDQSDDCPQAGAIVMVTDLDVACVSATDTVTVNGIWTLTATVLPDQRIRITFSNGQVSWSTIEVCYSSAPRAPWAVNRY